jgi:hypothetical protein
MLTREATCSILWRLPETTYKHSKMDRNEKNQFNINKKCYVHLQKSVGYTKTKLGLDTKFESGISSNTFRASEGQRKSHLAAHSPRLLPASTRASCLSSCACSRTMPAPRLLASPRSCLRACSPWPTRAPSLACSRSRPRPAHAPPTCSRSHRRLG